MDKIILNDMAFFGYHGVLKEETVLGQKFFVDIVIDADLKKAGQTDDLSYGISYAEIFDICKYHVESKTYKLLESIGENIASEILAKYELANEVWVKIKKPEAPIAGIFGFAAIEIRRTKNAQ